MPVTLKLLKTLTNVTKLLIETSRKYPSAPDVVLQFTVKPSAVISVAEETSGGGGILVELTVFELLLVPDAFTARTR